MKYILLKRRNFGEYVDRETNDLTLSDLTHFLSEIDFDDMDKYIAWAKDKKQDSYGTNTTYIEKYAETF